MKNLFKTSSYLIFSVIIAMMISTVSALAWTAPPCDQEECTAVLDRKGTELNIGILPDANMEWPIVLTEPLLDPTGKLIYGCGLTENYPCLVWPYGYVSGAANLIQNVNILIPFCCDNPIQILASSKNSGGGDDPELCSSSSTAFPTVCNAYSLEVQNLSGNTPDAGDLMFWFSTPIGIDTGMISIAFNRPDNSACEMGIKGPTCTPAAPPVRSEPVRQCYQFTAENQDPTCENEYSTWVIEYDLANKCKVLGVWAGYSNDASPDCNTDNLTNITENGKALEEVLTYTDDDGEKDVTTILAVDECDIGWIQSIDPLTGCNDRCYKIGGRLYCF